MTPFEINLLFHLHTSPSAKPAGSGELLDNTFEKFCIHGLAEHCPTVHNSGLYKLTPLGKAYLDVLMNTPIPTIDFIDGGGQRISQYTQDDHQLGKMPEVPKGGG